MKSGLGSAVHGAWDTMQAQVSVNASMHFDSIKIPEIGVICGAVGAGLCCSAALLKEYISTHCSSSSSSCVLAGTGHWSDGCDQA
jgi:methylaspartate ammonia-lyase